MADSATMKKVAEDFGYQLAFLKSDPGLYSVFQKAVAGKWDANRFVAAVRATKWYKTHSETWRQNTQLMFTDPKSFSDKVAQTQAQIRQMAGELGISLDGKSLQSVAEKAFRMGYSSEQIQSTLVGMGKGKLTGLGSAGEAENALRLTAYRNGVSVSDSWISSWVSRIQGGMGRIEDAQQALREKYAAGVAPGFAKELAAGQDLYDLASPYMQTMAKTLELNPGDIDLFDPTIRKALASSSDTDGKPGSVPLWQFERELKKDKRWMATTQARDQVDQATRNLSQLFGVGV